MHIPGREHSHIFVRLYLDSYQNNHYSKVQFPLYTFMNQKSQTKQKTLYNSKHLIVYLNFSVISHCSWNEPLFGNVLILPFDCTPRSASYFKRSSSFVTASDIKLPLFLCHTVKKFVLSYVTVIFLSSQNSKCHNLDNYF